MKTCNHVWKTYESIISIDKNFEYCGNDGCGIKKTDWDRVSQTTLEYDVSKTPTASAINISIGYRLPQNAHVAARSSIISLVRILFPNER